MNSSKNINLGAENKLLLDQNMRNNSCEMNNGMVKLNLNSEVSGASDSNVNRSEYFKCNPSPSKSGMNRSVTNGTLPEGISKHDKSNYVRSHCRNSSYEGLLMHSRHNSDSCSSVASTSSSSHSRHNSGDSNSLFPKSLFEWKSNSTGSDLDSTSSRSKSSLFKWNLFTRGFEPPCMASDPDGLSVHSNSSILSNNSREHETVTVSSTALIPENRPKELPAKSEEEKQKHEREYLKMLENIKKKEEVEMKAKKKQLETQLKIEEQQINAVKVWTQEILPHWENMKTARKTRDLWWKGLPPCVRSKVWYQSISNELNITRSVYDHCMKDAEARSEDIYDNTLAQIRLDISRTFPHLCLFQTSGPYHATLRLTLAAYVSYNDRISYVQGMSYICATFLINLDTPFEAFTCFANFLDQTPLFHVFYSLNIRMMQAYYATYSDLFKYNLPRLHRHFAATGLSPDLYLLDWIYTLFSKAMGLDLVCRIWDLVMRDGEVFVFRAALGILHMHEDCLLDMDFLQGSKFLTKLPDNLNGGQLFKSIGQMSTTIYRKSYETILDHHKTYV